MKNAVTHCIHGHLFNQENTIIKANGNRTCRVCAKERARKYRESKSANNPTKRDLAVIAWTPQVSDIDLSWVAGLFEGEGTVTIIVGGSKRNFYRLVITLTSSDFEMIDFLNNYWQGTIRLYQPKTAAARMVKVWTITSARAGVFIQQVLPFIKTKRVIEKMKLGLEMQSTKQPGMRFNAEEYRQKQQDFYKKFKEMNKRGV